MRKILIIFILFASLPVFSQKVKTVKGEYTYYVPENVAKEQAMRIALERAKIQALADEFGTIVQQTNVTKIHSTDDKTSTDFFTLGDSEVKGEWIETTDKPDYEISYVENTLVVTCKVKGKAREIVSAQIDFRAHVLRNGTDDKFEDDDFKSGDALYLSFRSPVSGYLAVYLVTDDNMAFCLLPYRGQDSGIYPIEANRRYVFFSEKDASNTERSFIDEYYMTCESSQEHNLVYVVFSPNQFAKAADISTKEELPRQLSFEDFQEWLTKCRKYDNKMNLRRIPITIKNK